MPGLLHRTYRNGIGLLLAILLAACSTAPTRMSGGNPSYSRTEPGAPRAIPPGLPQFIDHSVGEEEISIEAMSLVGIPYRWGGNTPDSGFDCSGLVTYVVRRAASVNLPRTTEQMESVGTPINPDEISPGDLIFFNTTGRAHSHVGIYVGQYRFVNAPSTGGTVRIDYVTNPYWAKRFDGIRRVASGAAHDRPFETAPLEAAAPLPAPRAVTANVRTDTGRYINNKPQPEAEQAMETNPADMEARPDTETDDQAGKPDSRQDNKLDAGPAETQFDTQSKDQPDPIAEIANLSGAGNLTPSAPQPIAHPVTRSVTATIRPALASTPQSLPNAIPSPTAASPTARDNSPVADPIAGFANSSM